MANYELLPIGNQKKKKTLSIDEATDLLGGQKKTESSLVRRAVGDTAVSLGKGVVGTGEALVGLANIVSGGRAGKIMQDYTGYDPKRTKEFLENYYSPQQQEANEKVQEANGFVDTTLTSLENPSTIFQTVVESTPSMFGGGAVAQGLGKLGLLANNPIARGAIGEGLVSGGQTAEEIRQENPDNLLTGKQALASTASGLTTGLIGYSGGKLAQKLGILDPQTILAGGGKLPKGLNKKTFSNIIKGAISEGAFQELPQSATEQMWQNYAQDKNILEGVPEAAATGLLAGGFMGAGANLAHSRHSKPEQQSPTTSKELLKLGYDTTPKLGYEGLQSAPDIIYQGTDYIPPPSAQIGYDNPNSPQSANFNPYLSNQYDPVIEGLNNQANYYGMPEPSMPSGTITKALLAGGLEGINTNTVQTELINQQTNNPIIDNSQANTAYTINQPATITLPKRYPINSRAKEVNIDQLKEIVRNQSGDVNTIELMEYTGSNHLQAARAINDVRHEIDTLNREFTNYADARRALNKLDKKIAYRTVQNSDSGKWQVTADPQPLTDSEIQNLKKQQAKKQRQLQRKRINTDKDSLLTAIIKLGGISTDWRLDTTADSKGNKNLAGVGYLWSDKTGTSIDDVARRLADEGYIPSTVINNDDGVRWLQEAIKDELAGRKHYALNSEMAFTQQYEQDLLNKLERDQADREDEYLAIREQYGIEAVQQARFYDEYATNYLQNLEEQLNELEREATIFEGEPVTEADAISINNQLRRYDERANQTEGTTASEDERTASNQQEITSFDLQPLTEQSRRYELDARLDEEQKLANERKQQLGKQQVDNDLINLKLTESIRDIDIAADSGKKASDLNVSNKVKDLSKPNNIYKIIENIEGKISVIGLMRKADVDYQTAADALANYPDKQKKAIINQAKIREIVRKNYPNIDEIDILDETNAHPKDVGNAFREIKKEEQALLHPYIDKKAANRKLDTLIDRKLFEVTQVKKAILDSTILRNPFRIVRKSEDSLLKDTSSTPKKTIPSTNNTLTEELTNISENDLSALIDEIANETKAVETDKPVKERKQRVKKKQTTTKRTVTKAERTDSNNKQAVDRTATRIAKDIGVDLSSAGKNAVKGVVELFGGKGKLSSGLTFDEQTYAKAKPHFVSMLKDFQNAGKNLRDFIRAILDNFGTGVKPYVLRFAQDVKEGNLDVSDASVSMERDSQDGGVGNATVQETISDESTGTRQSTGTASQRTGKTISRQQERDNQLSNTDAITNGKPIDSGVYRENTTNRATQPTTRSGEQGRVSSDNDLRQDVEQARTTAIIENSRTREPETLHEKQLAANKNIITKFADENNIKEALPVLFEPQQEDVYKAEKRFYKDKKNGIMFTNGTGTGKTGTGSGVIRRFVSAGKNNIIVVVPNNSIAGDWLDFLKNKLDVSARQLTGITDNGGEGVVVTTYANFGLNNAITKRTNDLIVADESHYLSSEENGGNTNYLNKLRLLTGHKRGKHYFAESYFDAEYKDYSDNVDKLHEKILKLDPEKDESAISKLRDQIEKLHNQWRLKEEEANAIFDKRPKSKVVMLSATPFSYVKSVDYAEGYLFDYSTVSESDAGGYNSGGARERFFMENFGYRMRNNKLTRPDGNVNNELMEQQFNEKLKASGALSGRRLDIPYDYDRKFFYTEDAAGTKLDLAFAAISEAQQKDKTLRNIPSLYDLFPHHERMYLLEAIKAKHAVDYIKQNLALGRKVVVFHDFNKGGAWNPYELMLSRIKDDSHRQKVAKILARPEFKADFSDLISPIDRFSRDFDKVLFVNGTMTKKQRKTNLVNFNDDNSGYDLLVAQSDAAREGSSMHDTTSLHKRVLINLGMPTRPVKATQIEGRIYRTGQASNAIFRYFTTGTGWESSAFTHKVAERSGTAENLALGREARALKKSFLDAYANATDIEVSDLDGVGGKEYDQQLAKSSAISPFEAAKTYYYGQQKNAKRRDQREGFDYYATPEPVGFKITEWADIVRGDKVLEPSAGHGAIARFIPEGAKITAIEPSYNLSQRIGLSNADAAIINDSFENHNIVNKYDAIVMNPPYGAGGKTAMEHLQKAIHHLKPNGRVVAIVPIGQFDKRFDNFLESKEASNINIVAKILLPSITFEKAGTGVMTQVLIIDNNTLDQGSTNIDLTGAKTINELFDRIEHIDIRKRTRETKEEAEARKEQEKEFKRQQKLAAFEKAKQQELATVDSIDTRSVIKFDEDNKPILAEHITKYGKVLKGVIAKLTKTQAQAIDPYAIKKPNGYFIRESYLDDNNNFIISNNDNAENKPVINLGDDGKPLIVEHTTGRGKVIRGVIANISKQQAKAIDKYTFQKNSGFFIREEYLDENGNLHLDQQYSRKGINQGSNAETLQSFINNTVKGWKNAPVSSVVQSIEDLPEAIRNKINKDNASDASGIQHNGKVYLIADNIESTKHASFVVEHEILGHYGLRGLFGNALNPILSNIYTTNPAVKQQADQLTKQYGYSKLLATEEVLADMAATDDIKNMPFWSKLVAAFRNFSRKLGLPVHWTTNDIAALLGNARRFVESGRKVSIGDNNQQYSRISQFIDSGLSWLDNKIDRSQPLSDRLSSEQRRIMKNKFAMFQHETIKDKIEGMTKNLGKKFVQGVFDSFAPLKELSETAYMQAHLSKGTEGAVEALLRFGKPKLTQGALDIDSDGRGLFGILSELNSGETNELNEWLSWMAANRAERLKQQDRENLFTDDDIRELKKLSDGAMSDGRSRVKVYNQVRKQFMAYNKSVLDIAEESGLIDKENHKTWESGFYLPFYRIADEDTNFSIGNINKLVGQKAFKKLKGGTKALDDLLVNIVSNWSHLLTASMKNQAGVTSLKSAVNIGIADKLNKIGAGEYINQSTNGYRKGGQNIVWVMEEGQQEYYQVNDPLVFDALNMINHKGWNNPLINVMGSFKKALTVGVTISPTFRLRNLIRDTLQATAVANLKYNPISNVIEGFNASKIGTNTLNHLMAGGGAIRFGSMNDGNQGYQLRKLMKELSIKEGQVLNTRSKIEHTLFEAWNWYKEVGDRAETVNRAAIYEQAIAAGKSHLQASFEARDLMNFTSHGKYASIRFLSQVVPFFNARLQGMYKLGRAAKHDPKRFAIVAGGVALASSLLYLLQKDDEDYKQLPDWVRDNYWYVKLADKALYIPKPFEIGALGTVVERGLEFALAGNDYTVKDFAGSLTNLLADQLAMNPIPQLVKPAIEASNNYNSLLGSPIDNMGQQRLVAKDRYSVTTSAGAIAAGKTLNISPQRIEYLVRGYFGWLGLQVLNITDLAARPLVDLPSNPNRDLSKVNNLFMVGDFIKNSDVGAGSKYLTRFYDSQQKIDEVYASLANARKNGELEYAKELAQDNSLKSRRLYNNAKTRIDKYSQQINMIRANKQLSASMKNERIEVLQKRRNKLAESVDKMARARGYL